MCAQPITINRHTSPTIKSVLCRYTSIFERFCIVSSQVIYSYSAIATGMPSTTVGFILALLAAFFNGSFLVAFKQKSVQEVKLHNFVFVFYFCTGVLLSSLLLISVLSLNPIAVPGSGTSLVFVPFGFLGGLILVASITFNFMSVSFIGIALSQGIFSGVGIIVSFLWGVIVFGETPEDTGEAVGGIVLLVVGIFIVANCHQLEAFVSRKFASETKLLDEIQSQRDVELPTSSVDGLSDSRVSAIPVHSIDPNKGNVTLGVIYAVLTGVAGGTILVPLHFVPTLQSGFIFIPSFGVGTIVGSTFILLVTYFYDGLKFPPFHAKQTAIYGILSGVIWNLNNILTVIAIPILGFALAFPLVQLAILVGGTWGIFLFGEIKGRTIFYFYGAGILVLVGAILLSLGLS